jgi:hypothetical protein
MGDQLVSRPLPKHRTTQAQNKGIQTPNIHALCRIRTHDPSFRASEDSSCLRPRGYHDRQVNDCVSKITSKFIRIQFLIMKIGNEVMWDLFFPWRHTAKLLHVCLFRPVVMGQSVGQITVDSLQYSHSSFRVPRGSWPYFFTSHDSGSRATTLPVLWISELLRSFTPEDRKHS